MKSIILLLAAGLLIGGCSGSSDGESVTTPPDGQETPSDLNAFFIGHSALNDIVADHVATTAELVDSELSFTFTEATSNGISLRENREVPSVSQVIDGAAHDYDIVVVTEMWDYQNFDPAEHGTDNNATPANCPSQSYAPPAMWLSPPSVWMPNPLYLQQYRDAFVCGNPDVRVYYYQTWSLGYNEVTNGATRPSAPGFTRPTIGEVAADIATGNLWPDLPLADRIEYEGVKWERFVAATNRPDINLIPAAYGLAKFMRDIEAGTAPGFEHLATTNGLDQSGQLAWADYLFYEDQYHLASIGQYLMGLMIYAEVFDRTPETVPVGTNLYPNSEYFANDQYPLEEVSDVEYQALLNTAGASGVYDLRGYNGKDYVPTRLRLYLQRLAYDTVLANR